MKEKVVLAYSGGLDTTAIIPWLKENYDYEVICCCVDVGQGNELDGLEERAKLSGATKLYIEDVVDEFVDDYVIPTVKADAVYENKYLLGTSFARPVIAKNLWKLREKKVPLRSATALREKETTRSALSYLSWRWLRTSRSSPHGVNWTHGRWNPAKMRSSTARTTALTFRSLQKTATAVTGTYGTSAMRDWN